jgi:hypothetical protein
MINKIMLISKKAQKTIVGLISSLTSERPAIATIETIPFL